MVKSKKHAKKNPLLLALVILVAVCAVLVLAWMLAKEIYLDSSKIAKENGQNVVINNVGAPSALVDALLSEKSGCQNSKNVDYIDKFDKKFAVVKFGCALDAEWLYKEQNGTWVSVNSTNQFYGNVPTCDLLKANGVPGTLEPSCYDGNLKGQTMPPIVANPVK